MVGHPLVDAAAEAGAADDGLQLAAAPGALEFRA
jgi:hypothetical protein